MSARVVVIGSLNLDLVVRLDRMPDTGETVFGTALEQHAGGKGLNQAVAVSRLGVPVAMVGAVGSDASADVLLDVVAAEGIDGSGIARVDGGSGTAVIEVASTGANRIVVIPGANQAVTPDLVRAALAGLGAGDIVLTQAEIPPDAVLAALAAGRAAGAQTIWNPAPAGEYPDELFALADIVVPNEHEAELLSGQETTTTVDATSAARALVRRGAGCVVVTRGALGSVWATATATGTCGAFRVVPVDTVAAGDAFCGGLAAGLAEGRSLSEALRWGNAAGALAATAAGAVPSLPRREAVQRLVNTDT